MGVLKEIFSRSIVDETGIYDVAIRDVSADSSRDVTKSFVDPISALKDPARKTTRDALIAAATRLQTKKDNAAIKATIADQRGVIHILSSQGQKS